jgi:hypothetical protein
MSGCPVMTSEMSTSKHSFTGQRSRNEHFNKLASLNPQNDTDCTNDRSENIDSATTNVNCKNENIDQLTMARNMDSDRPVTSPAEECWLVKQSKKLGDSKSKSTFGDGKSASSEPEVKVDEVRVEGFKVKVKEEGMNVAEVKEVRGEGVQVQGNTNYNTLSECGSTLETNQKMHSQKPGLPTRREDETQSSIKATFDPDHDERKGSSEPSTLQLDGSQNTGSRGERVKPACVVKKRSVQCYCNTVREHKASLTSLIRNSADSLIAAGLCQVTAAKHSPLNSKEMPSAPLKTTSLEQEGETSEKAVQRSHSTTIENSNEGRSTISVEYSNQGRSSCCSSCEKDNQSDCSHAILKENGVPSFPTCRQTTSNESSCADSVMMVLSPAEMKQLQKSELTTNGSVKLMSSLNNNVTSMSSSEA